MYNRIDVANIPTKAAMNWLYCTSGEFESTELKAMLRTLGTSLGSSGWGKRLKCETTQRERRRRMTKEPTKEERKAICSRFGMGKVIGSRRTHFQRRAKQNQTTSRVLDKTLYTFHFGYYIAVIYRYC